MANASDSKRAARLPEARVCAIVGVSQQRRQTWAREKVLRSAPRGGLCVSDAVELCGLKAFADATSPQIAKALWPQVGSQFASILPRGQLDLVFDEQFFSVAIARTGDELRALVAHGRLVRVIALGETAREIVRAFRRVAAVQSSPPGQRRPRDVRAS